MSAACSRWRSRRVDLRVLGTAGSLATLLAGCSNATMERNVYKDATDCASDYSAATCAKLGIPRADRFVGPVYRVVAGRPQPCRSSDPGPGRFPSNRIGIEPAGRFGFGTSCSSRTRSGGGSGYRWHSGG
jgi:hypothetical protein